MKIVVLGPFNSGKSSFIRKVCRGSSISLDKSGTTVSLDHGTVGVYGINVHLFGTPGLQRFEVIRKILERGADGVLFIVDSLNPASLDEGRDLWKGFRENLPKDIPIVVLANKQDDPDAISPQKVLEGLGIEEDVSTIPILGVSVKEGHNIDRALSLIVLSVLSRYFVILRAIRDGITITGIINELHRVDPNHSADEAVIISKLQWLSWRNLVRGNFETMEFSLPSRIREIVEIFEFLRSFGRADLEGHFALLK